MRKQHGPDLTRKVKPISRCVTCHGRGVTKGLFYEMECSSCNGEGWTDKATGLPLESEDARFQLNAYTLRLEQQIAHLQRTQTHHQENNRRGPGGSHRTGD
ncbi:hypothetical protein [Pseudomonas sp. Snoq117.2]|uniref:hypothetical protein n=1 Tax=Pseudomonas sp. Snoq117.2 TaxID=1500302 RepID=UPI0008D5B092|nr:hypothetical protein [Pseudomonas sp. Snoq117.2]SEO64133.1 hypothetical protein SAMN02787149_101803 [Pseudomonas sp. Snoq117.2]